LMTLQERDPMKPRTKKYLAFEVSQVLLGIWALLISSCTGPSAPDRPRDPWVFRSVLDERPRMITIALHKNMWSAYDTQKCGLYKAWKGGIDFDGAVYTTKHGPQPTSFGAPYLVDSLGSSVWAVSAQGTSQIVTPDYKGQDHGARVWFRNIKIRQL